MNQIKTDILEKFDGYDDDDEDLTVKYKRLWEKFVKFLDYNFEDFVSINHLGIVLEYLKQESKVTVNRIKPPYIENSK